VAKRSSILRNTPELLARLLQSKAIQLAVIDGAEPIPRRLAPATPPMKSVLKTIICFTRLIEIFSFNQP